MAALYALLKLDNERQGEAKHSSDPYSPWHSFGGWRLNTAGFLNLRFALPNQEEPVEMRVQANLGGNRNSWTLYLGEQKILIEGQLHGDRLDAVVNGHYRSVQVANLNQQLTLFTPDEHFSCHWLRPELDNHEFSEEDANLSAPMNGSVVALLVAAGQQVNKGDSLLIIEAMKMEHAIKAPEDGQVEEFFFNAGDLVSQGDELVKFTALATSEA